MDPKNEDTIGPLQNLFFMLQVAHDSHMTLLRYSRPSCVVLSPVVGPMEGVGRMGTTMAAFASEGEPYNSFKVSRSCVERRFEGVDTPLSPSGRVGT